MREILFRGKHAISGEWIYGDLLYSNGNYYIHKRGEPVAVYVSTAFGTVGQYTGLQDKHGTRIFEGDIIEVNKEFGRTIYPPHKIRVYWENDGTGFFPFTVYRDDGREFVAPDCCKVVGNIFDNSELLEECAEMQ